MMLGMIMRTPDDNNHSYLHDNENKMIKKAMRSKIGHIILVMMILNHTTGGFE